jgi:hypothetical protein
MLMAPPAQYVAASIYRRVIVSTRHCVDMLMAPRQCGNYMMTRQCMDMSTRINVETYMSMSTRQYEYDGDAP